MNTVRLTCCPNESRDAFSIANKKACWNRPAGFFQLRAMFGF